MAVKKRHDEYVYYCDGCRDTLHTDTPDWVDALGMAKEEGWKPVYVKGKWHHYCWECRSGVKDGLTDEDLK